MNFRYDKKYHPVAPAGRSAEIAARKMHKRLESMLQQQFSEAEEQLRDLESVASIAGNKTDTPATVDVRRLKTFKTKMEKRIQQQLLHTHDYSFDFGQPVLYPVDRDTQFLTLPFDTEWLTGPGVANKHTGELSLGMLGGNITVGAGLGLFLSSPIHVIADVRALMPIYYQWGHVIFDSGFTGSSGTVGILVYEASSAQIVADRRAKLWNEYMWMASTTTRNGEDSAYLSQTNAAQVSFHMLPGKKYQLWFWINISLRTVGTSIASAVIQAKIPLVLLNTAPPPIVN
jgi:hypothetical protein